MKLLINSVALLSALLPLTTSELIIETSCGLELYGMEANHFPGEASLHALSEKLVDAANSAANIFGEGREEEEGEPQLVALSSIVTDAVFVPPPPTLHRRRRNLRTRASRKLKWGFFRYFKKIDWGCRLCNNDEDIGWHHRALNEIDASLDGIANTMLYQLKNSGEHYYTGLYCVKFSCEFSDTFDESDGCNGLL